MGQHWPELQQALVDAELEEVESADDRKGILTAVSNMLQRLDGKVATSSQRSQALYQQYSSQQAQLANLTKSADKVRPWRSVDIPCAREACNRCRTRSPRPCRAPCAVRCVPLNCRPTVPLAPTTSAVLPALLRCPARHSLRRSMVCDRLGVECAEGHC